MSVDDRVRVPTAERSLFLQRAGRQLVRGPAALKDSRCCASALSPWLPDKGRSPTTLVCFLRGVYVAREFSEAIFQFALIRSDAGRAVRSPVAEEGCSRG